eukprot:1789368-Prymnesium_polylepis.6
MPPHANLYARSKAARLTVDHINALQLELRTNRSRHDDRFALPLCVDRRACADAEDADCEIPPSRCVGVVAQEQGLAAQLEDASLGNQDGETPERCARHAPGPEQLVALTVASAAAGEAAEQRDVVTEAEAV